MVQRKKKIFLLAKNCSVSIEREREKNKVLKTAVEWFLFSKQDERKIKRKVNVGVIVFSFDLGEKRDIVRNCL